MKTIAPYLLGFGLMLVSLLFPAQAQAKNVTENWYLEGPRSGADVKRVERAIRDLPGISYYDVSQATLEVRFDNQRINDAVLQAAVAHAGDYRLTRRVD
jgi:copper chaperone CopZ